MLSVVFLVIGYLYSIVDRYRAMHELVDIRSYLFRHIKRYYLLFKSYKELNYSMLRLIFVRQNTKVLVSELAII